MIALLLACSDKEGIPLHFDGPIAAAVIPENVSIFGDPVGVVANQRSGVIVPVDLKAGRLLTMSDTASFLRTPALPTGYDRVLGDVEVAVLDDGEVVIFTVDHRDGSVLRVPWYSLDPEGEPILVAAQAGGPGFLDVDSSGDDATLVDVVVRDGYTTTEDWSISYDGSVWWVEGSASGPQSSTATADAPWVSDHGELAFTLTGNASAGDRFEVRTETGITLLETAAPVYDLHIVEDVLWGSYSDDTGAGLMAWDIVTGQALPGVRFESDSGAGRMAWGEVDGVSTLFVANTRLAQVERVDVPALAVLAPIPAAAPVIDVAWSAGFTEAGEAFGHLFVAPAGALRVDVYDPVLGQAVDPNPVTPDVDGVFLGSPVVGLAASVDTVWLQRETEWGARPRLPTVSVSTADGYLYQLEGPTGCAVTDARGPSGPNQAWDSSDSYTVLNDRGPESDSALWIDGDSGEQATFATCGAVTQTETWTITYDGDSLDWEVEGSRSGVQANRAVDDQRYVSDTGAFGFLVVSGGKLPTDGDSFSIAVDAGLLTVKGVDTDYDGTVDEGLVFPGRPAAFNYLAGPTGGGWDEVDRREMLLLPLTDADTAARIELDAGKAEVRWQ